MTAPRSGPTGRQRAAIITASALTVLIVGVIVGMLVRLPGAPPPPPGPDSVDVGFAQDMSVHHQQAVLMAAWERDHTTDAALKLLASDIEDTQNNQVGRMQGWLELWGAASLPLGRFMTWMAPETGSHDHMSADGTPGVTAMPGMATSADLRALRSATSPGLDVLFLQLMLRHHKGGASMLSYAADHAALPQVRNLAAQMLSAQEAESDVLAKLLAERGGRPLPG